MSSFINPRAESQNLQMGRVKEWFLKYLYLSKATICIRGLVFSHSIVNHGIVGILIVYLTLNWKKQHFQIAAVITNLQEGFSDIMVIFLAHFSSSYKGSYNMILTTNAVYISGLAILWFSAKHMIYVTVAKVYYGAVILILLGEAGRDALLQEFLDEQYSRERVNQSQSLEAEELRDRQDALWDLPWLLGAIVPLFFTDASSSYWRQIFMTSTIAVACFYLLFICGYYFYFINRNNSYQINEDERNGNENDTEGVEMDDMEQRRNLSQYEEERAESPRGDFWVLIRKLNSKKGNNIRKQIVSVWLTLLVFSVVSAAGNTFFYEQMSNLHVPKSIKNYNIAVYLKVISSLSKYAASFLWGVIIQKKKKTRVTTMVRIGCGLACVALCVMTAWLIEIRRLKEVRYLMQLFGFTSGVDDTSVLVVPISIFWLIPQFCLLGIMEGLLVQGLIDFFVQRVADLNDKVMVEYYASYTSGVVIGVGKILTALGILGLRSTWFADDDINYSHLDKYYEMLMFACIGGFIYYACVSIMYYTKTEVQEEVPQQEPEVTDCCSFVEYFFSMCIWS